MSTTPRTDAMAFDVTDDGNIRRRPTGIYCDSSDVRELELEVASLKDRVALLTDTYETRIGALEVENNRLRDSLLAIHCDADHFRDEWIEAQSDGPRELILNIKKHAKL